MIMDEELDLCFLRIMGWMFVIEISLLLEVITNTSTMEIN